MFRVEGLGLLLWSAIHWKNRRVITSPVTYLFNCRSAELIDKRFSVIQNVAVKLLVLLCLISGSLLGDALGDIVGPVAVGPWSWYTVAAAGNATEIPAAALSYKPVLGPAAAGTFTLADACTLTLTGSGASEFATGDTAIVGWNATNGPGSGHLAFLVGTSVGNVLTSANQCGLNGVIPDQSGLTGLTVYHCTAQCSLPVPNQDASGGPYYDCTYWGVCSLESGGWNFYDVALALYRQYLVSCLTACNESYLDNFRDMADTWWLWALDQGGKYGTPSPSLALVSQYVRALDGHSERFAPLYTLVKQYFSTGFAEVTGNDNRDPGYMLLFAAVGARADTDPTRRAWYCSTVATYAGYWVAQQSADGSWPEKNGPYPYAVGGMSPWRATFPLQGLARSYDVLTDPTVCNNPGLAANVLGTIESSANFLYTSGYAAGNRGVYYDVNYPNDGQDPVNTGLQTGTVSVSLGSTAVTGSGTSFLTTFACNGTDYIGFNHTDGYAWTHGVASCADNTHLTLATPWGSQVFTGQAAGGKTFFYATTNANGDTYYQSAAAATNCDSAAKTCYSQSSPPTITGGKLEGYRVNNPNLVWIHGWLYKTTGLTIYQTRGDELFSATYGGPALGPGDNYPGTPGPCAGPACDGAVDDSYDLALHACAAGPSSPPCNPTENDAGGNVWALWLQQGPAKWYGQGSGVGGADNYLAWRLQPPMPEAQSIAFSALPNVPAGAAPFTLTASSTSGLDVSFTSKTTGICTVSGSTVTILASGGCSITASQAGNGTYGPAIPVTQSFTVLFNDVSTSAYYANAVDLFAQYGITAGCGNDDFCPDQNVTRAQMAVFIIQAIFGNNAFGYSSTPHFSDVQPGDFGFKWVQAMFELGITAGCGNGNYCPNDAVTRQSMAVFIIAARLGVGTTFTYPATATFADVPNSGATAPYFKFVQRMAQEGITGGCSNNNGVLNFCPTSPVTRGQMAVFMMVGLFNQLLPAGTPVLTGINPATLSLGTTGTFTITGTNTNFVQGTTTLSPIPNVTIGTITVNSATSLTVQLTAAATANPEPYSIIAITGSEQDVLPNGLVIQ
jgi:S-layer homology domain